MKGYAWQFARWISQRSVLLTRMSYAILFRFWEIQGRLPVVIYQMSKVGSSSIARSLQGSRRLAIFQVHNLRNSNIEASIRSKVHKDQRVYSRVIWESKYLNKRIGQDKESKPWHVITLVREPIARNISSFFQNIELWCPEVSDVSLSDSDKLRIVKQAFFERFRRHDQTLKWLDEKLLPVVGIDVYKKPFPVDNGFEIYDVGKFRLLLLRLENLKDCYSSAIRIFLGENNLPLSPANLGKEKRYAEMYELFLKEISFPSSYLDEMYNSKYMRHFYTGDEIIGFRKKWCRDNR